jgi:hypothetical protein
MTAETKRSPPAPKFPGRWTGSNEFAPVHLCRAKPLASRVVLLESIDHSISRYFTAYYMAMSNSAENCGNSRSARAPGAVPNPAPTLGPSRCCELKRRCRRGSVDSTSLVDAQASEVRPDRHPTWSEQLG